MATEENKWQPYIERLNTPERLQYLLLKKNIEAIDIMAANMLHPHEEYPQFKKLMDKLLKSYKPKKYK